MITAVIDIGSNSVRLGLFENEKLQSKSLITSRLGEGVTNGRLSPIAMDRTVEAVKELKNTAINKGAEKILAFATEAVRRAENRADFLRSIKENTGLDVYVCDGKEESQLAVIGGLNGRDGAVIDLGGASTEIAVVENGKLIYTHSLNIGAVVLNDVCGQDRNALTAYIAQKTAEYGKIPTPKTVVGIGGTATSLTACALKLKEYDAKKVDGSFVSISSLIELASFFEGKDSGEICKSFCVDKRRAEVIFGGTLLFISALEKLGANGFYASESDNLEGFYKLKG